MGMNIRVDEAASILGQRKAAAARYLLNRALIELVRLTPKEILGEEMGTTLESNAFNAYKSERAEEAGRKPGLQVELLGELSKTRHVTLTTELTVQVPHCQRSLYPRDNALRLPARIARNRHAHGAPLERHAMSQAARVSRKRARRIGRLYAGTRIAL